jgi:hypothetical protein
VRDTDASTKAVVALAGPLDAMAETNQGGGDETKQEGGLR